MANPNSTPDQTGASISAAELRRRLLASTPPPIVATAATPEVGDKAGEDGVTSQAPGSWSGSQDLLARLRMPGKSGPVPVQTSRPVPDPAGPAVPDPLPNRSPAGRRTPGPGSRLYGDATSAIAGALNQLADLSHGSRHDDSPMGEIQRLKAENKELRTLLDEMKHLLQEASETEQRLVAKEAEFESGVTEKDSQIDELSAHLGAIEEQIAKGELAPPPPVPKTRSELEEWGDDLEKESAKLAQDKKPRGGRAAPAPRRRGGAGEADARHGSVDGARARDDRPPGDRTEAPQRGDPARTGPPAARRRRPAGADGEVPAPRARSDDQAAGRQPAPNGRR